MSGRVLVAEDERSISLLVTRALEGAGCQVVSVHDGYEALELGLSQEFDLAILDQLMPGLLGLEVLKRWTEAGRTFPVIVLSALGADDDVVRGLALGAVDYVRKPFSVKELLARVDTHLRAASRPEG